VRPEGSFRFGLVRAAGLTVSFSAGISNRPGQQLASSQFQQALGMT
jgi:hypothetical protein